MKPAQLAEKVAKKANTQPNTAQRVITAFVDVLAEELRVTHECRIKNFGVFRANKWGGYVDRLGRLTPQRWVTSVRFSKNFKDAVNGVILVPNRKPKEIKGRRSGPVKSIDKRNYRQVDTVHSMIKHMAETGESVASQMEKRKEQMRAEKEAQKKK